MDDEAPRSDSLNDERSRSPERHALAVIPNSHALDTSDTHSPHDLSDRDSDALLPDPPSLYDRMTALPAPPERQDLSELPQRDPFSNPFDHLSDPPSDRPSAASAHASRYPPSSSSSPGPNLMQVGTVIIIGAMAANVIGFRYSRWAVGKEIHRAYQNQTRSHSSAAAARARRAAADAVDARRRAERAEDARRAYDAQRARRQEERSRADRAARDQARAGYEGWERGFRRGTWQENFKVEFDPRLVEELLRAQRGARGRQGGFGMPDELLQELLRAAQAAEMGRGGRGGGRGRGGERIDFDDFDPFRFWEQMHGAEFRSGGAGSGGGGAGQQGVFQRSNLGRHYSVLGVDRKASPAEIKAAYRKEVMKWHPDRYRGSNPEEAARKFREVTDAYNALSTK